MEDVPIFLTETVFKTSPFFLCHKLPKHQRLVQTTTEAKHVVCVRFCHKTLTNKFKSERIDLYTYKHTTALIHRYAART